MKEKYLKLVKLIDNLKKVPDDTLILVEGNKDVLALKKLGIHSIKIHQPNISISEVIENLNNCKECILLFDNDFAGNKLTKDISSILKLNKIKVNLFYRNKLFTKTNLKFIEDLANYLEKLKA